MKLIILLEPERWIAIQDLIARADEFTDEQGRELRAVIRMIQIEMERKSMEGQL